MSRYMKAMRDPDRKLSEFELAEWEAAVAEHEQKEAEAGKKMPVLARMQMEAKKRGIDSRNLNAIELKHLIKDYDERNEIAESDKETVSLGA